MEIENRIHNGWLEYNQTSENFQNSFKPIFDKYQYILKHKEYRVSLVHFLRFYDDAPWEIYQLEGPTELFGDVERFKTKEEAIKRVEELYGSI